MGEILPDGSIQGYQGFCPDCGIVIITNIQGNEVGEHECNTSLSKGDKITWTYKHWLNRKSFTPITKTGTFIRVIRPKKKYLADWTAVKIAVVQFDKNKSTSRVPLKELTRLHQLH